MTERSSRATRVLIANRGEIAVRVVRACRDLGLTSVAVYGDGDEGALHVELADEAYRLASANTRPYLDAAAVLDVARRSHCGLLHPGYGFLSENADFARACGEVGVVFVGPSPDAISAMGDKITARRLAQRVGVPLAAGSDGPLADAAAAASWAASCGYPVALKASAGGGGRGFRVVREPSEIEAAFEAASSEGARSFGDGTLYGEQYVDRPRHVEVQLFGDAHGRVIALGDRDCSIQRRHQKLVEECPAPGLSDALRVEMARAAVSLASAVSYVGAGTVEFLVDAAERFFFLEMNTRIQVEHTVTEEVFGVDLVREQLLVAMGNPLSFPEHLPPRGAAVQVRLNAEDPARGFAPSPGVVTTFTPPAGPGVRVDSALRDGQAIHPGYDSLIAKLVVAGADRDQAVARLRRALGETRIEGVASTLELHRAIADSPAFAGGGVTTAFLEEQPRLLPTAPQPVERESPEPVEWETLPVEVNGRRFSVRLPRTGPAAAANRRPPSAGARAKGRASGSADLPSPLQGVVLRRAVEDGATVETGALVLVVEAMKMENEIAAHRPGVVSNLVAVGATVGVGDRLFTVKSGSEA